MWREEEEGRSTREELSSTCRHKDHVVLQAVETWDALLCNHRITLQPFRTQRKASPQIPVPNIIHQSLIPVQNGRTHLARRAETTFNWLRAISTFSLSVLVPETPGPCSINLASDVRWP